MSLNINTKVKLNNGVEMPLLGLGTWEIREGESVVNAVRLAIGNGYRHIDTARIYGNEKGVGKGLKLSLEEQGINREDVFITTKYNRRADIIDACIFYLARITNVVFRILPKNLTVGSFSIYSLKIY